MLKKHYSAPVSVSSSSLGLYSLGLYSESLKPALFEAVTVSCQKMRTSPCNIAQAPVTAAVCVCVIVKPL